MTPGENPKAPPVGERYMEVGEIVEKLLAGITGTWRGSYLEPLFAQWSALLAQQLALREARGMAAMNAMAAIFDALLPAVGLEDDDRNVLRMAERAVARIASLEAQLAEKDARREIEVGNVIDELRGTAQARDKALAQLSSLQAFKEQMELALEGLLVHLGADYSNVGRFVRLRDRNAAVQRAEDTLQAAREAKP